MGFVMKKALLTVVVMSISGLTSVSVARNPTDDAEDITPSTPLHLLSLPVELQYQIFSDSRLKGKDIKSLRSTHPQIRDCVDKHVKFPVQSIFAHQLKGMPFEYIRVDGTVPSLPQLSETQKLSGHLAVRANDGLLTSKAIELLETHSDLSINLIFKTNQEATEAKLPEHKRLNVQFSNTIHTGYDPEGSVFRVC